MPRFSALFCLPPRLRRRARRKRMTVLLLVLLVLFLLVTPFYVIYKPPALLIRYFAHRWPDVLWHVTLPHELRRERVVALTIDDAPSSHTHDILEVLAEHGAHATFFVIGGQVAGAGDEALLADVLRGGHELGNHGMRDEAARELGLPELERQIGLVDKVLGQAYAAVEEGVGHAHSGNSAAAAAAADDGAEVVRGPPVKYYRPGSGFFSQAMRALVARLGYRLVLGDIYPHDAQIPFAWLNARHVLSMLRPGGIIICHDRRSWTAPMLKKVLPVMKRKGWKVVSLSELLQLAEE